MTLQISTLMRSFDHIRILENRNTIQEESVTKQASSSGSRSSDNSLSVAISAQKAHAIPDTYKTLSKSAAGAMVRILCEDSNKEAWKFSKLKDLRKDLKDKTQDEIIELMDAVDVLTIGCRTNPIPVQDMDEAATFSRVGCYKGARKSQKFY